MSFSLIPQGKYQFKLKKAGFYGFFLVAVIILLSDLPLVRANRAVKEPVTACVIAREDVLTPLLRARIAQCLGWQKEEKYAICPGYYTPIASEPAAASGETHILADNISIYNEGQSKLSGHVEIKQEQRVVHADTAYIYRNAATNEVTKIELLGEVRYIEAERLILARKVKIDPRDKSGWAEDVLYRFDSDKQTAVLPAWGQAGLVERFPNQDYLLKKASYTTCPPTDKSWHIEADSIAINNAKSTGVARNARFFVGDHQLVKVPYMSFPTTRERKSGLLLPAVGSSNVGGLDLALPYYWNIAPNFDATLTPHIFTKRGLMGTGEFRYLTPKSSGDFEGSFLPDDKAFRHYISHNKNQYPELAELSTDRWAVRYNNFTQINPALSLRVNVQQVSDDYYLQDFSNNLAVLTERQLVREAELVYNIPHWVFSGLVQSYQTLQPVNETPVRDVYQRLPQMQGIGSYDDLPLGANLLIHGQYDNFNWPNNLLPVPEGPRYFLNPVLSVPFNKPWGYVTPSVQVVQNYYEVNRYDPLTSRDYDRTIPRYSVDSGLYFDREFSILNQNYTQTLEPRVYYLYVPYRNQTAIPVYDAAYLIFNVDQLFRDNRFSGLDRIGDANQLSYALTSRWISEDSGDEKASFSIGQIHYFSDRRVQLCQSPSGNCFDNPLALGYLDPVTDSSPAALRAAYHFNPAWMASGDYVFDVDTGRTNNGHADFHYQPAFNEIIGAGYTYLTSGDITVLEGVRPDVDPLHQASVYYAWPFNQKWSSLGAFSYNISKEYEMMSFLGVQYDNCCWAVRLIGGRSFMNLSPDMKPQYNNNVYLQVQLKGLGSVGNSDPLRMINTFIPGYTDTFHRY